MIIADSINGDIQASMYDLYESNQYKNAISKVETFEHLYNCYIERVYVYPEYRNRGIGSYIFSNIDEIFAHCFNAPIHCFVTVPKPLVPNETGWIELHDIDNKMKQKMIDTIIMSGFNKLPGSDSYIKDCAL